MTNEFAKYRLEELEAKKTKTHKRHLFLGFFSLGVSLILAVAALVKDTNEFLQFIPFIITTGVVMPYFIFVPMKKKIQKEIDSRTTA